MIVWLILLLGLGYAGYWRFDHVFISPGLKESLTAAVDPANTESDTLADLRTAQSQIHTTRDAEVEAMLQRAVLLMQSAEAASQTASASSSGNSAELDKYIALERQYKRRNMKVPQSLIDYIQRATQEEQQAKKNPGADEVLDQQVAQDDSAQAAHLFQQLRAALGLPPVPTK
jgi:Skp family chaperone for outer membrane proteins